MVLCEMHVLPATACKLAHVCEHGAKAQAYATEPMPAELAMFACTFPCTVPWQDLYRISVSWLLW
jgi:hypothetical protein